VVFSLGLLQSHGRDAMQKNSSQDSIWNEYDDIDLEDLEEEDDLAKFPYPVRAD
jgi:hypothetical protein